MPEQNNPATSQTIDFLARLRLETAVMHSRLEETTLSKKLVSEDTTLTDYTRYLAAMEQVIRFTETTIFPLLQGVIADIGERRKLPLLQKDLQQLGYKIPAENRYQPFQPGQTIPFLLGYMYVIEGSTLGGKFILKHISQRFGIHEDSGASFFTGYGTATAARWKSFLQELTAYAASQGSGEEMITAAKHAFNSIYNFFETVE